MLDAQNVARIIANYRPERPHWNQKTMKLEPLNSKSAKHDKMSAAWKRGTSKC